MSLSTVLSKLNYLSTHIPEIITASFSTALEELSDLSHSALISTAVKVESSFKSILKTDEKTFCVKDFEHSRIISFSSAATLLAHKTDEQIKAVLIQEMIEESQSMSSHDEERSDDYSCIYNIISAKNTDEHSAAVLAFLDYLIATGSLNASDVSYENQSILRNTLTKVFEEKIQKYLSLVPTMVDIYLRGESIGFTKDFMEGVLESKMAEIKKLRTPQAFINEKLTLIIQSLKDRFCDSVAKIKLELKEDEYMYQETFKSANVEIVYLYDGVKKGLVINFT